MGSGAPSNLSQAEFSGPSLSISTNIEKLSDLTAELESAVGSLADMKLADDSSMVEDTTSIVTSTHEQGPNFEEIAASDAETVVDANELTTTPPQLTEEEIAKLRAEKQSRIRKARALKLAKQAGHDQAVRKLVSETGRGGSGQGLGLRDRVRSDCYKNDGDDTTTIIEGPTGGQPVDDNPDHDLDLEEHFAAEMENAEVI